MKKEFEYVGVVHVHTTYSDGTYTIPQTAEAATQAGLDFILITDHMTLEGLIEEGWYGNTLVLIGYEINDRDKKNHYLAFGLTQALPGSLSASQYVKEVRNRGGFGFISHPDEKRVSHPDYPAYPWTDWQVQDFDGVEIWNYMSEWMESVNRWNVGFRMLFPDYSIRGPTKKILKFWDTSNLNRKVVAIAGTDAHAMAKKRGPFRFVVFPYQRLFTTLRTHILLQEPFSQDLTADRQAVYGALREGWSFVCNCLLGDGGGFRFWVETEEGEYSMGNRVQLSKSAKLRVLLPGKGLIALIRNGESILETRGTSLSCQVTQPGFYRVEVKRRRRFWILSNPIYVERV